MRNTRLHIIGLALFIVLLEAIVYLLFEFQNAWPYNDETFEVLQIASICGIGISTLFSIFYRQPYLGSLFLILSILMVTIVSKSGINLASVIVNLLIIFLILLSSRKIASLSDGGAVAGGL